MLKSFRTLIKNLKFGSKIPAVKRLNNTISLTNGMKPKDALKLDTAQINKKYPEETMLPEDRLCRYLYQPGKQHGDQKRRTTDFIVSKNTYRLDRIVQDPGSRVLYYLQDEPDRAFLCEQLMHVSEDSQAPLDWVGKWK